MLLCVGIVCFLLLFVLWFYICNIYIKHINTCFIFCVCGVLRFFYFIVCGFCICVFAFVVVCVLVVFCLCLLISPKMCAFNIALLV